MLNIGTTAKASLTVTLGDTALALCLTAEDAFPRVFATSRMIALMEIAAARLLKPVLAAGQLSVGVALNVKHTAATPVGARVTAIATLESFTDKVYRFRVEAFDEAGPIGEGEHIRAIITTERLLAGAARRSPEAAAFARETAA